MRIRAGFTIGYDSPQPVPMLLLLSLHPSREVDLLTPQVMQFHMRRFVEKRCRHVKVSLNNGKFA